MTTESQKLELLQELLFAKATTGLNHDDSVTLNRLLSEFPDTDIKEFEILASHIDVAITEQSTIEIPKHLRESIIQQGEAFLLSSGEDSSDKIADKDMGMSPDPVSRGGVNNALWGFALAASLLLAVIGWLPRDASIPAQAEPTLSQNREALINNLTDTIVIAWTQTDDPLSKTVTGDIVWSNQAQEGYMRFQGLPVNDPQLNQYQLWIFDEKREKHPVDGGVFDALEGELIIPIREKLQVYSPTMFAVTLEQPGGVVVSDKEHIVAIAKIETG